MINLIGTVISGAFYLLEFFMPLIVFGVLIWSGKRLFEKNHFEKAERYNRKDRGSSRYYAKDADQTVHTKEEVRIVDDYLKQYFSKGKKNIQMPNGVMLVLRGIRYHSLDDVDVYVDRNRFGTLFEYRMNRGQDYNRLFNDLIVLANKDTDEEIIDASFVKKEQVKEEPVQEEMNINDQFIMKLNELNIEIPDKEISNMLYETTALLRQLDLYQKKFKETTASYDKLYEYYLPMIVRILEQYVVLQVAKKDPNYQKTVQNVKDTISSLNGAIKDLIKDTTDQDFMNISADISTLDSLLKKDGFGDGISMKNSKD